ncbi:MAG: YIP1 family protein [Bdellovibrionaceae bacterium]|nr:YIP1 family protein [Pseudobdellovibrionaceae bacterium]
MKEVNPEHHNKTIDIKAIIQFFANYVKHPVKFITEIPDWNLPSLFFIQISVSVISGLLTGLLKMNFYRIANGIILMPIVSTISSLLLTALIYYYFQFVEEKTESFKKLFSLVIIASIPFYLFQIISEYFSPIALIGFSFTSALLVVGLNETFKVEKKRCYQIVGTLFALVLLTWIANKVTP